MFKTLSPTLIIVSTFCIVSQLPDIVFGALFNFINIYSFQGSGALICSIDNMPAQIPKEATDFFGNLLLPYIPDMVYYFTDLIYLICTRYQIQMLRHNNSNTGSTCSSI